MKLHRRPLFLTSRVGPALLPLSCRRCGRPVSGGGSDRDGTRSVSDTPTHRIRPGIDSDPAVAAVSGSTPAVAAVVAVSVAVSGDSVSVGVGVARCRRCSLARYADC